MSRYQGKRHGEDSWHPIAQRSKYDSGNYERNLKTAFDYWDQTWSHPDYNVAAWTPAWAQDIKRAVRSRPPASSIQGRRVHTRRKRKTTYRTRTRKTLKRKRPMRKRRVLNRRKKTFRRRR